MTANDFCTQTQIDLWFTSSTSAQNADAASVRGLHGSIVPCAPLTNPGILEKAEGSRYRLLAADRLLELILCDANKMRELDHYLMRNTGLMAYIKSVSDDSEDVETRYLVCIKFFLGAKLNLDDFDVAITDDMLRDAIAVTGEDVSRYSYADAAGLRERLKAKCAIMGEHFLMRAGGDEDAEAMFHVYAPMCEIDIAKAPRGDTFVYEVRDVKPCNLETDALPLRLCRGSVCFSSEAEALPAPSLVQEQLRQIAQSCDTFFERWDYYCSAEGNILLDKARKVGEMTVSNVEKAEKGLKLFLEAECPAELAVGDAIAAVRDTPIYLLYPDMTWTKYRKWEADEGRKIAKAKKDAGLEEEKPKAYRVIAKEGNSVTIGHEHGVNAKAYKKDHFVLSILGDEAQISRREGAREKAVKGESAMPSLSAVLGDGDMPRARAVSHIQPLSEIVNTKIFHGRITQRQMEAIDIALNTPDIAVIQGPPGTGKTTVICAILERLNEISDKSKDMMGQFLVSSSQHVAIENLVERLSINSMPAVKKDAKEGYDADDISGQKIKEWIRNIQDALLKDNPKAAENVAKQEIEDCAAHYMASPSRANTKALLGAIIDCHSAVSRENANRAQKMLAELESVETASAGEELITAARALRINALSFADDGVECSNDLVFALHKKGVQLPKEDMDALEAAASGAEATDALLAALGKVRTDVIDLATPRPVWREDKASEDVLELIDDVKQDINSMASRSNTEENIIAAFYRELQNNPDGVKRSIERYSPVWPLTVQHAGSKKYAKKNEKGENTDVTDVYDTVIIDEAARVSPLDLLIPMSQAKKRIILVGDHRQLPQMVEENIMQRAMNETGVIDIKEEEARYKESLFEYLFNQQLPALTAKDGIVRRVTLNAQYRMHPVLGNFISEHFYPGDEGFASPRPAEDFACALPDCIKAAVWLDVPYGRGSVKKQKGGTSLFNDREAEAIAQRLETWLLSDEAENKKLTFAVICMYGAQVEAVKEKLRQRGINARDWAGRLEVGTVDAFQGKEFDVVILSLVRSCTIDEMRYKTDEQKERAARRAFGFIASPNRLCVAMSRQKKVLVAAGNGAMYTTDLAREVAKPLYDFYALCNTDKGAVING